MKLMDSNPVVFVTICLWTIFLLLMSLYSVIRAFALRRKSSIKLGACVRLLLAFVLNQGIAVIALRRTGTELAGLDLFAEKWMNMIPAEAVVVILTVLTALEASSINSTDDYLKRRITVVSIKEATERCPAASWNMWTAAG